jgi:hypothetical protein
MELRALTQKGIYTVQSEGECKLIIAGVRRTAAQILPDHTNGLCASSSTTEEQRVLHLSSVARCPASTW